MDFYTYSRLQGKKAYSSMMLLDVIKKSKDGTKIYIPSITGDHKMITVTCHSENRRKATSLISRLLRYTKNNQHS